MAKDKISPELERIGQTLNKNLQWLNKISMSYYGLTPIIPNLYIMFRLDNYMEEWAIRYKGMLHTLEEPRFFRCNSEFTVDQFLQNYQDITHPVCGIVTHLEGTRDVTRNLDRPRYICLFLAYADADNYKAQADAKEINKNNADAFLAKLYFDSQQAARQDRRNPLATIDLTNVRYDTIGPITSKGWFELTVTIESQEFSKACYSPEDYI